MRAPEQNIPLQVQIWAVIGPFLALLTLFVLLVRSSPSDLLLPSAGLIGVLICWKWKLKGLAISLGALAGMLLYQYPDIPVEERFWEVGLSMALALGFVVTALSFEEVEEIVRGIHEESLNRLQHLWTLDEKLKNTQRSFDEMGSDLRSRLERAHQQESDNRQLLRSYERIIAIARQEISESQQEIEKIKRENASLRSVHSLLEEKCEQERNRAEEAMKQLREAGGARRPQSRQNEELIDELLERVESLTHQKELLESMIPKS